VAFLGLGIMGAPMAANLARAGFHLAVWNRTRSRAEEFVAQHGGRMASSPAQAARASDIVITMVVDAPDVEEVLFDEEMGALAGLRGGGLVVDMSTIAPSASVRIAERLRAEGVGFLDAPVTGSRPRAEDGTLTIMAGGSDADFKRAKPVLEGMGELIVHVGPQGHGSMVKLINNTVAAVNAATLAEALMLAQAAKVDTDRLRQVMAAGSGASAMLTLKAEPMLEHQFDPLFKLAHMLKDVDHCLEEAKRLGVPMPLGTTAERLYTQADRHGLGEHDFAAVITALEESGT
jgi:3-hydroxyisobutyrate dehydrogenase-like beta-hydroxyacid dehydrogenase